MISEAARSDNSAVEGAGVVLWISISCTSTGAEAELPSSP